MGNLGGSFVILNHACGPDLNTACIFDLNSLLINDN